MALPDPAVPDGARRPRVVRTIVMGYTRGELPTTWLVTFHRFERAIARAGFDIRVRLDPLEEMPEDGTDLLVVPSQLRDRAQGSWPQVDVWVTDSDCAIQTIDRLLGKLRAGVELCAERLDPNEPRVVRYRGFLPL